MDDIIKRINMKAKEIKIPSTTLKQWQELLNLITDLSDSKDALLTKSQKPYLKILKASQNKENPFSDGEKYRISGLYCEKVIEKKEMLEIKNAEKDSEWKNNPALLHFNLKSYLAFPILLPDGEVFGTICIHDNKEREFSDKIKTQLKFAKELIESNLEIIYKNHSNKNLSRYYSKLLETLPVGVMIQDKDGIILKVNKKIEAISGYSKENLISKSIFNTLVPEEQKKYAEENIEKILAGEILIHEISSQNKNGEKSYLRLQERKIKLPNNSTGIISIQSDITDKIKAEKEIESLMKKQQTLLDNIDIQIWFAEDIDTYGLVNKAHADFLGLNKKEIEGAKISDILKNSTAAAECLSGNKYVFENKEKYSGEEKAKDYKGDIRYLSINKVPILTENNEVETLVCTAVDITEKRKNEEKIKYASYHDSLTNLYNRAYLEKEIQNLNSEAKLPMALIMADLNGLKLVNDTYGHNEGDILLKKMAAILKDSCRGDDIVARWGGDEFIILLPETDKEAVKKVVKRINKKIADEFIEFEDGSKLPLSAALGYGVKKHLFEDVFDILATAEDEMYKNKLTESRSIKSNILNTLLKTLSEKSQETSNHSNRMAALARKLAEAVDLSQSEVNKLTLIARLHDIGKTVVPEKVLNKQGKLTEAEWKEIKSHPAVGHRILNATEEFSHISEEILSHHEKWDGSGYPRSLKGEEIPLLARIIAIVDAYDVMTTEQVYKESISKKEALKEIEVNAGTQFDPDLAKTFVEIMTD